MFRRLAAAAAFAAFAAVPAFAQPAGTAPAPVATSTHPTIAIAVLNPTAGSSVHGVVRFLATDGGVKVVVDVEGLQPGQQHAIHIHEYGDCSMPDGSSAGSHFNPEAHPHGMPNSDMHHAGDLGNLQADKDGKSHYEITLTDVTLMGEKNPIVGRGVIVHAKPDDGGQPVGNAGGRLACGTIGIAKAPQPK